MLLLYIQISDEKCIICIIVKFYFEEVICFLVEITIIICSLFITHKILGQIKTSTN
jgi:hypothetical protein